ncbi:MAG: RNB domain-containing ribonuclease [Bacillota bacterium]|nr:RNB domain-containing ribonuclease [Bacillota bacterium]
MVVWERRRRLQVAARLSGGPRGRWLLLAPDGERAELAPERAWLVERAPGAEEPSSRLEVATAIDALAGRWPVDLELLWSAALDEAASRGAGSAQAAGGGQAASPEVPAGRAPASAGFTLEELARLYLGQEAPPEALLALAAQLAREAIFFEAADGRLLPRSAERVETARREASAMEARSRRLSALAAWVESLRPALARRLEGEAPPPAPPDPAAPAWIHEERLCAEARDEARALALWALHGEARTPSSELVEASGLEGPDEALELFEAAGILDQDVNETFERHELPRARSPQAVEEARRLLEERPGAALPRARAEAVGAAVLAIDSAETREVDDAVSFWREGERLWLGVHIAAPALTVPAGGALDQEAMRRGETFYFPEGVVPMFPEELVDGWLSLSETEARPAVSVYLRFDAERGELLDQELEVALLRLTARLTYEEADLAIAGAAGFPGGAPADGRPAAGARFRTLLGELRAFTERLEEGRAAAGAHRFDRSEVEVRVRDGRILVEPLYDTPARRLVAEAMVWGNHGFAGFLARARVPAPFRTSRKGEGARVSVEPGPHEVLALNPYIQATSPLRRFGDLVAQRQLIALARDASLPYDELAMGELIGHIERGMSEVRHALQTRQRYWLLRYLELHRGESFEGQAGETGGCTLPALGGLEGRLTAPARGRIRVQVAHVRPRRQSLRLKPLGAVAEEGPSGESVSPGQPASSAKNTSSGEVASSGKTPAAGEADQRPAL